MLEQFTVEGWDRPTRLDRVLAAHFTGGGRRAIQSLMARRKVKINGRLVWLASWLVHNGDRIELFDLPAIQKPKDETLDASWIVAQSPEWIAVNKPAGLLSHATRATDQRDLQTLLRLAFGPLSLFHRLDRDTSGLVLFTYHGPFNRYLDAAFKNGTIRKEYLALVEEQVPQPDEQSITARLAPDPQQRERMVVTESGGQEARTDVRLLARHEGYALVACRPITGRTHQIRVHLASVGAPIAGDRFYHPRSRLRSRLMLHAFRLLLPEADGFPAQTLMAPPGEDFVRALPASFCFTDPKGFLAWLQANA